MEQCIKEVKRLMKSFPDTDNKEKVERNLIEMAEDKYEELVVSGCGVEEARQLTIESICSNEDIKEALGVEDLIKDYSQNHKENNRKLVIYVITLFTIPVAFIMIDSLLGFESFSKVIFLLAVLGMSYCLYKIVKLVRERGKNIKIIENETDRKLRRIRKVIIAVAFVIFLVCAALGSDGYYVVILIAVSIAIYYLIKYYLNKNSEKE